MPNRRLQGEASKPGKNQRHLIGEAEVEERPRGNEESRQSPVPKPINSLGELIGKGGSNRWEQEQSSDDPGVGRIQEMTAPAVDCYGEDGLRRNGNRGGERKR